MTVHKRKAGAAVLFLILVAGLPAAIAQERSFSRGGPIADRLRQRLQKENDEGASDCQKSKIAGLDVAIWQPAGGGPAPLVIFSHGFGGSNTQSTFIMKAMANAGYLVIAPNHKDCHGALSTHCRPEVSFKKEDQWNDKTFIGRHDDILNLLSALHKDSHWSSKIDWSKLALCGHSLGGYTALGLGGAWPSWKLDSVKAVIALSPYTMPYVTHGSLGSMKVPVMYQGGTKDWGCTPFVKRANGAFSQTASPACFVEFDKFNHFTWCNFNHDRDKRDGIDYYCIAFLDRYVKGESDNRLEKKLPGVTELEIK